MQVRRSGRFVVGRPYRACALTRSNAHPVVTTAAGRDPGRGPRSGVPQGVSWRTHLASDRLADSPRMPPTRSRGSTRSRPPFLRSDVSTPVVRRVGAPRSRPVLAHYHLLVGCAVTIVGLVQGVNPNRGYGSPWRECHYDGADRIWPLPCHANLGGLKPSSHAST
jgi:hypothetical protein